MRCVYIAQNYSELVETGQNWVKLAGTGQIQLEGTKLQIPEGIALK